MRTVKILFALFGLIVFLGCEGVGKGSSENNGNNDQPSSSAGEINIVNPGVVNILYSSQGFNCSNPESNSGYTSVPGTELIINFKMAEDIIIVDILDTAYASSGANTIFLSGVLDQIKNENKILEIAFCNGNVYVKAHTKAASQAGIQICDLNDSESGITCSRTEIKVNTDGNVLTYECYYPFVHGDDKKYFLFTKLNGTVRALYFSFNLSL